MIIINDILRKTREEYNTLRIQAGQPPVSDLSRQIVILTDFLVTAINKELDKKADVPNRLSPSYRP